MSLKEYNVIQEALRVRRHGLLIGTDAQDGKDTHLMLRWLRTGLHVLGLTGSGKTRWLLWLVQLLALSRAGAVILLDPKGELFRMTRDWALGHGLAKRVVLFDPADEQHIIGYNPLKPNGLQPITHSKAVRESIGAAWGAQDFFATPLLARTLLLTLAVSRLLELTLVEALRLLMPQHAQLRQTLLPRIPDPYVRDELAVLIAMSDRRREEQTSSTVSRLEGFIMDPLIRRIVTQQRRSLDIAEVIREKKILLVNLAKYQPLRKDDVALLGRLIVNDVLVKVFERAHERVADKLPPVFLMIDEVQSVATSDLCDALDQGRGLGLCTIAAHQFLDQLRDEEKSGYLYHSLIADARTKVIFDARPEDLESLAKTLYLDRWSPWHVKDEIVQTQYEPYETVRTSTNRSLSGSRGRGIAEHESYSVTESESESDGESIGITVGTQRQRGTTRARSRGRSVSQGSAHTAMSGGSHTDMQSATQLAGQGSAASVTDARSIGMSQSAGSGIARRYEGMQVVGFPLDRTVSEHQAAGETASNAHAEGMSENIFAAQGVSSGVANSQNWADADTQSSATTDSESESDGVSAAEGRSIAHSRERSHNRLHGTSHAYTQGTTISETEEQGWSKGETTAPFTAFRPYQTTTSRTFLPREEFYDLAIQQTKSHTQHTGNYLLKIPTASAALFYTPWVSTPFISRTARERAEGRMREHSPYYSSPGEIDAEEHARTTRLLAANNQRGKPLPALRHPSDAVIDAASREVRELEPAHQPPAARSGKVASPPPAEPEDWGQTWRPRV